MADLYNDPVVNYHVIVILGLAIAWFVYRTWIRR